MGSLRKPRYLVAVLAFMIVLGIRILGRPLMGNDSPFLFFFSALAFAAWYGGLGPGILATLLGAIAVATLFLPPITQEGSIEMTHALHLCVFIATGVFVSVLTERLHDAIQRAAEAGRELEDRVRERTAQLAQTNCELQAEKNKLTGILDQMQEAIFIVNPQYEIEYANPAMQRMFGPIGEQKCYQYMDGANETNCARCKNPEIFEGESLFQEWRSPKNGKVYDCSETPIAMQNGFQYKLKIMHDITELKSAEADLLSKNRQIQWLSGEILKAQESERMRISRELHDELGQSLTLIKLKIGLMEMIPAESQQSLKAFCEEISAQVDQVIENMRRLSRDLSPVTVEALGITIALRRLAEGFSKTGGMRVALEIDEIDHLLSLEYSILLFRIMQEGLNNAAKHAQASAVNISMIIKGDELCFELADDGNGFRDEINYSEENSDCKGMGLSIMRERVRMLGGALTIQGQADKGTRLRFVIPIRNKGTGND